MMRVEGYDTWQRGLRAVAEEYVLRTLVPAETSLALWQSDSAARDRALAGSTVARALGIHARRALVWTKSAYSTSGRLHVKGATSRLQQEPDGTWTADYVDLAMVEGHPTMASAQEHLERLLGSGN